MGRRILWGLAFCRVKMANYGYIENADFIQAGDFERDLKRAVQKALGEQWVVRLEPGLDDGGPVWVVSLPGTAPATKVAPANLPWFVDDLDIGFLVAMQPGMAAFRHAGLGPSYDFARWAQGCVEEELAELWGKEVLYDATDERYPPGTRRYRIGKGFRDFLLSQHEKPDEIEAYIESRYKPFVPPGFW